MNAVIEHLPHPAPETRQAVTPMDMIDRALVSGAAPETLERLLALQERWEAGQARKAFDAAISEAKAEIPIVAKNATGHNSKRYADFAAYAAALKPILAKHGLSYRFRTDQAEKIMVTCILSHRDGHSEESSLSGPADASGSKNAIQAIGSTLTYLQRYTLVQALGLAAGEDDDGKAAHDGEFITPEQVNELREIIAANDGDLVKFCEFGGVAALSEIRAKDYENAMRVAKAKGARK